MLAFTKGTHRRFQKLWLLCPKLHAPLGEFRDGTSPTSVDAETPGGK